MGAVSALPLCMRAAAQQAPLESARLNDSAFVVFGPTANVLVADSSEGLVMVDGGEAAWSAALLTFIASESAQRPVRALINTHWHAEQTGSNLRLGERDVEIVAHDNTRLWLSVDVKQRWSGTHFKALPDVALPTAVVQDTSEKAIGGLQLQLGYLMDAHTDGDLYVYLPEANLMFAGGFLTNDRWPLIDWWTGGWTGGMLNAFDSLLPVCNEQTVIVPCSGPLMSFAELKQQREMYLAIFDEVHTAFVKSLGPDETVQTKPAAGYKPEWGDADLFVKLAAQSLQGHLRGGVGNWLPRIP